jgi:hypothetical protein
MLILPIAFAPLVSMTGRPPTPFSLISWKAFRTGWSSFTCKNGECHWSTFHMEASFACRCVKSRHGLDELYPYKTLFSGKHPELFELIRSTGVCNIGETMLSIKHKFCCFASAIVSFYSG